MTDDKTQKPNAAGRRQIRVEVPATLEPTYANAVIISQTSSEIIMDFTQLMPNDPRARVKQRVVMTPTAAKSFMQALTKHMERFEEKYGEIKMPPTLADQLFSGIRSDGTDGTDDGQDDE